MSLKQLALTICLVLLGSVSRSEEQRIAVLLDIRGPIGPAASDYVDRSLERARENAAVLVILRIDTPGGLDTSMREIVRNILSSPLPVVSFVAPSGARAASAGTYIVYASHVAAMAPGTNLGAATPVSIGLPRSPLPVGDRDEPAPEPSADEEEEAEERRPPPALEEKAVSDAVAYIRSLAQLRGRNADWAEKAVREAASLSAEEALAESVIDLISGDLDDLLRELDGRTVNLLGTTKVLETNGIKVVPIEPDWRTKFLSIITNPNVAYILMLVGIYGLIIEFYTPGLIFPGVVGAISLLVALYAFHVLPIN